MVQRCVVKKCVFALSVTTCLVSVDLAYAKLPADMSDSMKTKGLLLSRRPLSSSKSSPFFDKNRLLQKQMTFPTRNLLTAPRFKGFDGKKSGAQMFWRMPQKRTIRPSFNSFLRKKSLDQLMRARVQTRNPLVAAPSLRLPFLAKKPLAYRVTPLAKTVPLELSLNSFLVRHKKQPSFKGFLSASSSAIRLPDLSERSFGQRKLRALVATKPTIESTRRVGIPPLDPTAVRLQNERLSMLEQSVRDLINSIHSAKDVRANESSERSLGQIRVGSAATINDSIRESTGRMESPPSMLESTVDVRLRSLESSMSALITSSRDISTGVTAPNDLSDSPSLSQVKPVSSEKQPVRSRKSAVIELSDGVEDSRVSSAVSYDGRIDTLEQSMAELVKGFSSINERLLEDHTLDNLYLQQDNLAALRKRSTEFKEALRSLDPVVNRKVLSEGARRRVEGVMSDFSDYLGWTEELDFKVDRLLNPLDEQRREVDDSTETSIQPNSLHLVLRLRAGSSHLSTEDSLEEKLRSSERFIEELRTNIDSVASDLSENHTEENLRSQHQKLDKLMKETDEVESGLLSLKSRLSESGEQGQVQKVLTSFDEIDGMFAQAYKKIDFLKSRSSALFEEQLRSLDKDIKALEKERESINADLYEDQKKPSSLKGHGKDSLQFQGTRLSQLQEKSREIAEQLLRISSQMPEESPPKQKLKVEELVGSFNDTISFLRQVQTRRNFLSSKTSVDSLETDDPIFSFIPNFGVKGSQTMVLSDLSTDFTPEEELQSLKEPMKTLKRDIWEFEHALSEDNAVTKITIHEDSLLKVQESARELESRLMRLDSQITSGWLSSERQQMNDLMYSFGDTLCLVRKAQARLNFLKSPPSSSPSLSSPTVTLIGTEEISSQEFKSEEESLLQLSTEISKIDAALYEDHTESNLNGQGVELVKAKTTLRKLEERLTLLDSQTPKDVSSKSRKDLDTLLGSLSTRQCSIRDVEKRLDYLKSSKLSSFVPVIPIIRTSSILPELTDDLSSSVSTEDPVTKSLTEVEESLGKLGIGLIDEALYGDHAKTNLTLHGDNLSRAKDTLNELSTKILFLKSQISSDLSSPHRMFVNALWESCQEKQCQVPYVEKRLDYLKVNEELREAERTLRALRETSLHIDGALFDNHAVDNLDLQAKNLLLLEDRARVFEEKLSSLDKKIMDPRSQQRKTFDEVSTSLKETLCLRAIHSRIESLRKANLTNY